jgi:hypothetical protein
MKYQRIRKSGKIIVPAILSVIVSSCATYKSSFGCSDASGAYCASMDRVDQMIDSGEIERFNEQRKSGRYKAAKNNEDSVLPAAKDRQFEIINYDGDDAFN